MSDANNLHKNHRKRLKQRFLQEGLENFKDHNILELLLFYSVPRKDTNNLAHELIEKFGSLSAVFDADYEALQTCDGISENTATFLKLIPQLARAYLLDKDTRYSTFGDSEKLGKFLVNYFIGEPREKLIAIYMNSRMEMIDICVISTGTVISSEISVRKIAEAGFAKKAATFILAHNHPDGNASPSDNDLIITNEYRTLFNKLGMPLVEHYVIGGSSYRTICGFESAKFL